MDGFQSKIAFIWSVVDLLRGLYRPSEYGRVILPLVVLRRLDCVFEPTKQAVLDKAAMLHGRVQNIDPILEREAGEQFYNLSRFDLRRLLEEPADLADNLQEYVAGFSANARDMFQRFGFTSQIERLDKANLLYLVLSRVCEIDLHRDVVSNVEMGYIYEELVRRFSEQSNETAGEHFTPREVVRLMVELLFLGDEQALSKPGIVRKMYDPACGAGGMLSMAEEYLCEHNPSAQLKVFGQELNNETFALARANVMLKDQDAGIYPGNSFSDDRLPDETFDYMLANPPFGVEWKKVADKVRLEHEQRGFDGRFGAGLPRINDGSLLFLQHMLSKMRPVSDGGSRLAIIFNGSPLVTGAAGSGESEIRRWIIENDWLEAIVALPDQLFYNTGISTYFWVLTNRKSRSRRGKVQLVDARDSWVKMRKSLGEKRKGISEEQIREIVRLYDDFAESDQVKIFPNEEFGFQRITVERPLRLRWEVTDETLLAVETRKPVTTLPEEKQAKLVDGLGLFRDRTFASANDLQAAIAPLLNDTGSAGKAAQKAVLDALSVRDPEAPPVTDRHGSPVPDPDPEQPRIVRLPLDMDPDEYLLREIFPYTPDAWIDQGSTEIGYAISPMLFFRSTLDTRFVPLQEVLVQQQVVRPDLIGGDNTPRQLRMADLYTVDSADELPEVRKSNSPMMLCTGGDVVGYKDTWRVLPPGFGEAVTSLVVLRPRGPYGRGLCEWLNSHSGPAAQSLFPRRPPDDLPVPIDLISDDVLDELLTDLHSGRMAVRKAVSDLLPSVFDETKRDARHIREDARAVAVQAALVGDVVGSVVDPVWQAEWTYPFHVAALARRYRLSSQPAERKDALLKLGEGVARTVGILVLSEFVDRSHLPQSAGNPFRRGATFGTWTNLIEEFGRGTAQPRMQELAELRNSVRLIDSLREIKDARNDSSHAHGVRADHQLEAEVEALEPLVVRTLTAANWLSKVQWDWVQRCEYQDESSYLLIGQRLRGSHPDWEPFQRNTAYPLRPDRLYAGSDRANASIPVDLTPLAAVRICAECRSRELFQINQVRGNDITLRSLEDHSANITQSPAPAAGGGAEESKSG